MYALFFTLLLFFLLHFVRSNNDALREGVTNNTDSSSSPTYQSYSGTDPMILAQKNAANIQYLQEKLKDLQGLESNFNSLNSKVGSNTDNIRKCTICSTNYKSNRYNTTRRYSTCCSS